MTTSYSQVIEIDAMASGVYRSHLLASITINLPFHMLILPLAHRSTSNAIAHMQRKAFQTSSTSFTPQLSVPRFQHGSMPFNKDFFNPGQASLAPQFENIYNPLKRQPRGTWIKREKMCDLHKSNQTISLNKITTMKKRISYSPASSKRAESTLTKRDASQPLPAKATNTLWSFTTTIRMPY